MALLIKDTRATHTFIKNEATGSKYKAAGLTPLHVLCGAHAGVTPALLDLFLYFLDPFLFLCFLYFLVLDLEHFLY